MKKFCLEVFLIVVKSLVTVLVLMGVFAFKLDKGEKDVRPIIYKVDSADSTVLGRVQEKTELYGQYQLVIDGNYFQVSKLQYEAVNVGDVVYSMIVKGE